ncbi:MAG: B12-binding domain-containing radical SAM protein [Thermodesulfobacteriota bacterium]
MQGSQTSCAVISLPDKHNRNLQPSFRREVPQYSPINPPAGTRRFLMEQKTPARKIILIQPTFSEHEYAMDELTPPMALLHLAGSLLSDGFETVIINQQIDRNWEQLLAGELQHNPVCVGITSLTGLQIYFALKAAKQVKLTSSVPVVWGGIHATMVPEHVIASRYIDYVLTGECENSFPQLVRAIFSGNVPHDVPGIVYRDESGAVRQTPPGPPPDLALLPPVPFHLDRLFTEQPHPRLTIITSRGCPHRCSFCFNNFYYHRKWRAMESKEVLALIDHYLKEYGPGSSYRKEPVISFGTESNFFVSAKRVDEICQGIIDRGIPVTWEGVSCRVDYHRQIKPSTLKKLHSLGCDRLLTGVEGGNQEMFDRIKKDIKLADVFAMGEKLIDSGIKLHTSFIMGLPGETHEDRLAIIDLINELRHRFGAMHTYGIFIYAPFPGTELWDKGVELGFTPPTRLTQWVKVEQRFPQRVPWLTESDRQEIKRFREIALVGGVYGDNSLAGKIYSLFGKWGSFRFRHHLFGAVPELKLQTLLNDIYNLATRGRRRKYQTFHHDPLYERINTLLTELE